MLLGPVGDDHGRVKGALRALGAWCGQTKAMLKSHDADTIATIRLGLPVRTPATEAKAEPFDAIKLSAYCVLLRDESLGGDLRIETRTGPSFFSRRPSARRLDTSAEPSGKGV